jgi:hypothetical protein
MNHGALAVALGFFGLAPSACGNDDPGTSGTSDTSGSTSSASATSSGSSMTGGGEGGIGGGNGVGGMGGSAGMGGMGGMAGAGGMGGMGGGMAAVPKPDFKLIDTNPNSPTVNAEVSPSQYLGKISAWYFGHGT